MKNNAITVRSKSPLRLGLAGGGTDVSPYSEEFGGCVLNVTIDMYAYCTIVFHPEGDKINFVAKDLQVEHEYELDAVLPLGHQLDLHVGIYNRVVKDYCGGKPLAVDITTYSDAPPGSGLGSSSTMVVAILGAFQQLLNLPLGEYDLAKLAYDIERKDLALSGGKQDQYATTFGGFNFMEFYDGDKVIVNPLRIKDQIINELESYIMLYYTGISRSSAKIIDDQVKTTSSADKKPLEAMHKVKELAYELKEQLLMSNISEMAQSFKTAWMAKKSTSSSISNDYIDEIETLSAQAGAISMKVSGAGGGGFIMMFVEPTKRLDVINALKDSQGEFYRFKFTNEGTQTWKI
ncbi:dehydrogenase [Glaciecola sp. 2405UD65-10]|uniref:GHMP family kinase ATP-binding protein n=1 Tax=Glaciecola sp. 2405UD65-10 TaxID=3397244 RepID=UPI003B5D04BB